MLPESSMTMTTSLTGFTPPKFSSYTNSITEPTANSSTSVKGSIFHEKPRYRCFHDKPFNFGEIISASRQPRPTPSATIAK
ncbi:hypothetical protein D3C73_1491730 [compost metagenome]